MITVVLALSAVVLFVLALLFLLLRDRQFIDVRRWDRAMRVVSAWTEPPPPPRRRSWWRWSRPQP